MSARAGSGLRRGALPAKSVKVLGQSVVRPEHGDEARSTHVMGTWTPVTKRPPMHYALVADTSVASATGSP